MKHIILSVGLALGALGIFSCFGQAGVSASRDYVNRRTTLAPVTNDGVVVGFKLGIHTNDNETLAAKSYVENLTPGNYEAVSNAAMNAGTVVTSYTGYALAEFANTGTVFRSAAITDGTNTIDAAGGVSVSSMSPWQLNTNGIYAIDMFYDASHNWWTNSFEGEVLYIAHEQGFWTLWGGNYPDMFADGSEYSLFVIFNDSMFSISRQSVHENKLVGKLALTNDIPNYEAVSDAAMNARSKTDLAVYTNAVVGYTEWVTGYDNLFLEWTSGKWVLCDATGGSIDAIGYGKGNAESVSLTWSDDSDFYDPPHDAVTATRRPIYEVIQTGDRLATTGTVASAIGNIKSDRITDGTNTIDAAGNVYEKSNGWTFDLHATGMASGSTSDEIRQVASIGDPVWGTGATSSSSMTVEGWFMQQGQGIGYYFGPDGTSPPQSGYAYLGVQGGRDATMLTFSFDYDWSGDGDIITISGVVLYESNVLVGKLALTNDIPDIDYTTSNTQLVATIEATAPAPGNYSAVSNAAMNARSMTDLGVRGAPQGEGSWFMVNGERIDYDSNLGGWGNGVELLISKRDHDYLFEFELWDFPFSLTADFFSTNVYYVDIDQHTNAFVIIGYTNTIAQVSQIPSASDAQPLMDGQASSGLTNEWARADHRHPSDTSKQDALPYPTNEIPYSAISGVPSFSGLQPFDFSDMRGVYLSLSNIIHVLGGSVTNFPTFNQ